jgi:hypothetical protein
MKTLKYLKLYIKYHKAINDYYEFSLGGTFGGQVPENLNWFGRTDYWYHAE